MGRMAGINLPIITAKGPNLSAAEVALLIKEALFLKKVSDKTLLPEYFPTKKPPRSPRCAPAMAMGAIKQRASIS